MTKRVKIGLAVLNLLTFLFWGSYVMIEVIDATPFRWWELPLGICVFLYFGLSLAALMFAFDPYHQ